MAPFTLFYCYIFYITELFLLLLTCRRMLTVRMEETFSISLASLIYNNTQFYEIFLM